VSRHVTRQLKEALKAKVSAALLQAAQAGSAFMIPKLLDTGVSVVVSLLLECASWWYPFAGVRVPSWMLLGMSVEEILKEDLSALASRCPPPDAGLFTRCFRSVQPTYLCARGLAAADAEYVVADVDVADDLGQTPLMIAAFHGVCAVLTSSAQIRSV
jgi:hypothetical protein